MPELRFRAEGSQVLWLLNGRLIASMPWDTAAQAWKALRQVTKKAEEEAKATTIIADQALLYRAGATLGLTNRRDIQAEAVKESAWNRALRRYLPGGVKSRAIVGTPRIQQFPPFKKEE